jgi:hypothetical protein
VVWCGMSIEGAAARLCQLRDDGVRMLWGDALMKLLTTDDESEAVAMYISLSVDVGRRLSNKEDAAKLVEGMRASITTRFGRTWHVNTDGA